MIPSPATPPLKNYTVFITATNMVQIQAAAPPTVSADASRILQFGDVAAFQNWVGWFAGTPVSSPAPTAAPSSGGFFGLFK